jgi:fatty acid desaturase
MNAPAIPRHSATALEGTAARVSAVEWPTVALIATCVGGWLALTSLYGEVPTWLLAPATTVLLALHSSVQHEIVHGHPTRWSLFNRALGVWPLSIWIPFERYRALHLVHHVNARLTDPFDDPESNYWTPEAWQALSALERRAIAVQQTLLGRLLVGSWWRMGRFLRHEASAFVRDEPGVRAAWSVHLLCCVPVVLWIVVACGIPLWLYVGAMVIPANGILLIRSFAEHRAKPGVQERTAIVEGSWLLGPLFLFNNLHALHHEEPWLPWYRYHARYRLVRDRLIADNGGLVYHTYFDVARRFLLRPHDQLMHPTVRRPAGQSGAPGFHAGYG